MKQLNVTSFHTVKLDLNSFEGINTRLLIYLSGWSIESYWTSAGCRGNMWNCKRDLYWCCTDNKGRTWIHYETSSLVTSWSRGKILWFYIHRYFHFSLKEQSDSSKLRISVSRKYFYRLCSVKKYNRHSW